MKKKIYFLLLLVLAGMAGVNAQVRISGSEAPNRSAVLDLNPDDLTSEGNATKGLAMPRVRLKNTTNPYPLLSHVKGMTVYNLSAEGDVTPGVYTADGSRWIRQADSESLENLATNIYSTVFGDTIINYITGNMDNTALMDSVINRITNNNEYIEQLVSSISSNIYNTELGDSIINYITQHTGTTVLGDSIAYYISQHFETTQLGDTVMRYITSHLDNSALMDSVANFISNSNEYLEELINSISSNIYNTVLGDTIVNYITQHINTSELGDGILEYITQNVYHTALSDSIINLVYENERDGIIGNEVTGATPNGGLTRSGAGTVASPYTLGIASGGITNTHLANSAVSTEKIGENAVTSAKIADGAITNADINASAAIALNKIALPDASANNGKVLKSNGTAWVAGDDNNSDTNTTYSAENGLMLAGTTFSIGSGQVNNAMIAGGAVATAQLGDKSVTVAKINATGTASSTGFLRGDGAWAIPEVDGQGVTSVSGANGITVSNGTTTPTVSLPAGTTSGNVLKWNGTAWASAADAGITAEQDGIIGNEVTNATNDGGLSRSGSGTAASPYTLGIAPGGVTNTHLANSAVSSEKISDGAVTSAKIADEAITNADINASAAIALNKIALPDAPANNGKVLKSNGTTWVAGDDNNSDTNTTYSAGNGLTLDGTTFSVGTGQVNSPMIADGAVATAKLAANAVTSEKIADGAISNADISATAGIAGTKLADKSVTVAKVNASGTASSTGFLRGDGAWAAPVGDGQGVTSVSGANGITVSNETSTPVISLPVGTASGNVLKWNGTAWASAADAGITDEQDGIIGNEVTDATSNGGLTRSGTGITASPYTLGIASGGVTNTHLANSAVTSEKISENAVTSAKIADGAITNADINTSAAIALNKIALPDAPANNGKVLKSNGTTWVAGDDNNTDANTTYSAGNGLTLDGTTFSVGTGRVNSTMIADGAVATAKLADNAVTSTKIVDGTIANSDISATAGIAGTKLADKSVTVAKVNATGTASSTTFLRGDGAWSAPAGDGQGVTSVSGANGITVGNGTTTPTVSLPAGTTSGNVLKWNGTAWASAADAGITAEQDGIVGNEVTNATSGGGLSRSGSGTAASPYTLGIASGGVTNTHLANGAVTSEKIGDNAVTSAKIADGAITNADINASAAIALNKIALPDAPANNGKVLKSNGTAWVAGDDNNTDTNTTYSAGTGLTLTGTTFAIQASQINSAMIADGAVKTDRLADNAVTSEKIANGTIKAEDLNSMGAANGQVLTYTGSAWAPADNYARPITITDSYTAAGSVTAGGYSDVYIWTDLQPGLYSLRLRLNSTTAKFKLVADAAYGTSVLFEVNSDSGDSTAEVMFNYVYPGTLRLKANCTGGCPTRIFNLNLFRF